MPGVQPRATCCRFTLGRVQTGFSSFRDGHFEVRVMNADGTPVPEPACSDSPPPSAPGQRLAQVVTSGFDFTTPTFDLSVRRDDPGQPGTTIAAYTITASDLVPTIAGLNDYYFALGAPLTLPLGHYWLVQTTARRTSRRWR